MKFLCDRCKTRYSIGDERVRGKILKIRCKNCANVITVREGMSDADAPAAAGAPRRNKTTTAAPIVQDEATAQPNGAGTASTKPPAALEEEWYVSIDGDQSGPYSLAEAQRWVAGKVHDADLHCWSEGFDDWLPVDKVSHFRGLRKKPAPPMTPPPVPRGGPPPRPGAPRAITAAAPRAMQASAIARPEPVEDEPKPLFAATMASLEKATGPQMAFGGGVAVEARSNGAARTPVPVLPAAKPALPAAKPALPAAKPAMTMKGIGAATTLGEDLGGATQPEGQPFRDEQPTAAEPVAAPRRASEPAMRAKSEQAPVAPSWVEPKKPRSLSSLFTDLGSTTGPVDSIRTPPAPEAPPIASKPIPSLPMMDEPGDPDDLDIGEVSRVVKLADIMRPPTSKATAATAKRTGVVTKINGTAPVALIDAVDAMPDANAQPADVPLESIAPIVAVSHRRGMIALLVGALLLVGATIVVVVLTVGGRNDTTSLGGEYNYNGERPDNPIRRPGDPPIAGSAELPQNPFIPRPPVRPRNPGSAKIPDPPPGNSLKSDEIEGMARSTSSTTTACFRRADKGADAIRLADVKKIRVTFKVAPDGTVSNVDLSEKSSATLVSCLTRMISSWKFRSSSGGDFGFVFAKPE